jgi:hypothetical protein
MMSRYTSRGHNLRFFDAVIFESAWSLTRSAIVILLSSVKDHADPKRTRQKPQIVTARSI